MLVLLVALNGYSQKINTDAISEFWNVVDYLKKDRPLTDSVWNKYYNLYGNKNYMNKNRSEANVSAHRKYLEFLFRTSFADSLKYIETNIKDYENDDIFQNLKFIKANEHNLRKYSNEIQKKSYLKTSIKLAKKHLPKYKYNKIPQNLTIYVMAMTYDAAVQDSSMYLGISCVYDLDRFQKGSMAAHELHHILRKNNEPKMKLSQQDSASVRMIDQINNEGCADLIDKKLIIDNEVKILIGSSIKNWLLNDATNTIRKLDSSFVINSLANKEFVKSKEFRKITASSSGHIPGYYMVAIIKRNGYLQDLIDNNANPFNFFYLYNKAAKIDKQKPPLFSMQTINYLKKLEQNF